MKNAIILAVLFGWSVQASAVTIDFEEFSEGYSPGLDGSCNCTTIQSMGFDITGQGFDFPFDGPQPSFVATGNSGSLSFVAEGEGYSQDSFGPSAGITLTNSSGDAFALYSVDWYIEELSNGTSSFTGMTSSGDTVTLATPFGTGGWLDLQSMNIATYGDGFTSGGIARVELDNIVVGAAVPIPAAVWLFGSGLLALGIGHRMKNSKV